MDRITLWKVLQTVGIPPTTLSLLTVLHGNTQSKSDLKGTTPKASFSNKASNRAVQQLVFYSKHSITCALNTAV